MRTPVNVGYLDLPTGLSRIYTDLSQSDFAYSLKLLRKFYSEDLVDHKTFLTWLVQQMTTCNLAQAGFLTRLVDEYLADILTSRALSKPLVEACLAKLSEVSHSAEFVDLKIN